jgi:hypothetical protein
MSILNLAAYSLLAFSAPEINHNSNLNQVDANAINVSSIASASANIDIFAAHIEKIKQSLPSGLKMRLPSGTLLNKNTKNYTVEVSSVSQSRSTVNLYNCEQQQYTCLVGSFSVASTTSNEALQDFQQYQRVATPLVLKNNIQAYLLHDRNLEGNAKFSSVMWLQDGNIYTVKFSPEGEISKIANSMVSATPIENLNGLNNNNEISYSTSVIAAPELDSTQKIEFSNRTQARDLQTEEYKPSPVLQQPTRLFNLETANQLQQGTFQLTTGFHQPIPEDKAPGTGYQIYYAAFDWAPTDKLQFGFAVDGFDDNINSRPIKGKVGNLTVISFAPSFKYQLFKDDKLSVAVSGSAEYMRLSTTPGLFNNFPPKSNATQTPVNLLVGTLQLPVTYNLNSTLQAHITPGAVFFPDKVNGADFFGTYMNLGTGLSWQASQQLNFYANANVPFGSGGNALDSKDGSIFKKVLWAVGTNYAVDPRVGVELYATNAFGKTPATSLLAFIPDGDQIVIGGNVRYLFDIGQNYASSFRPSRELTERDASLVLDGFTLSSASTLGADQVKLTAGLGTESASRFIFAYGAGNNLQIEGLVEQTAGGNKLSAEETGGSGVKIGPGAKIRFLDQSQGDPVSLSFKISGVGDLGTRGNLGTLYTELPILYQPSAQTALFFNPKAGFNGNIERWGIGVGINQAVSRNLQLIGEFTPVFSGQRSVWSAGVRYFKPSSNLAVDVYAGNAVGQTGLSTLVGEPGTNLGFNLHWLFKL